jgi:hypothetical protein
MKEPSSVLTSQACSTPLRHRSELRAHKRPCKQYLPWHWNGHAVQQDRVRRPRQAARQGSAGGQPDAEASVSPQRQQIMSTPRSELRVRRHPPQLQPHCHCHTTVLLARRSGYSTDSGIGAAPRRAPCQPRAAQSSRGRCALRTAPASGLRQGQC